MNTAKQIVTAVVFLAVVTIALPASAQPFGKGHHPGPGRMMEVVPGILMGLDLSDDQQEKAADIVVRYKDMEKQLLKDMHEDRTDMQDLFFAEPFDEDAIREAFRENAIRFEEMVVLKGKMIAEIKGLLYPEQIATLKSLREKMSKRHKEGKAFRQKVRAAMMQNKMTE